MPSSIYAIRTPDASEKLDQSYNYVTVARAVSRTKQGRIHRLNKTIYANGLQQPYDFAYQFNYYTKQVHWLGDLADIVRLILRRPEMCLLRGVAKDDKKQRQWRLFHDHPERGPATIIEQDFNWFALDIDGVGQASGDIVYDSLWVRNKLGFGNVECFAIPSANYLIKSGIRLRLFFWAANPISCRDLKRYFNGNDLVDSALFHPIQPIYTARPTFNGLSDPCNKLLVWMSGDVSAVDIPHSESTWAAGQPERKYTKKQAERFVDKSLKELEDVPDGERHVQLFRASVFFGKLAAQELVDEDEVKDRLFFRVQGYWHGNPIKDRETINAAFKRGWMAIENESDERY